MASLARACSWLILMLLLAVAVAIPAVEGSDPETASPDPAEMPMMLLFEATLDVNGEAKPPVQADDPLDRSFSMSRDLVAQGDGTIQGPNLKGSLTWSLLARQHPDHDYARTHFTGWLETGDGAEIFLRASGYAPNADADAKHGRLDTGYLTFEADLEPEFEWLNSVTALWQGRFDPLSQQTTYRAFVPIGSTEATAKNP